eukprot:gene3452-13510_t
MKSNHTSATGMLIWQSTIFQPAATNSVNVNDARADVCVLLMPWLVENPAWAKLSSLLEVVRLTYEEGFELGQLLAAAQLDEDGTKRETGSKASTPGCLESESAEESMQTEEEQHSEQLHNEAPPPQWGDAQLQHEPPPSQWGDALPHHGDPPPQQGDAKLLSIPHQHPDSTDEKPQGAESLELKSQQQAMSEHKQRVHHHLQQEQALYPHQQMYPYHLQQHSQGQACQVDQARALAPLAPQKAAAGKVLTGGPCESCRCTESPQWRRPEPARMLLCNRCGIHYGRYKKWPAKKHQTGLPSAALDWRHAHGEGTLHHGEGTHPGRHAHGEGTFPFGEGTHHHGEGTHPGKHAHGVGAPHGASGLPPVYRERHTSHPHASHDFPASDIRPQGDSDRLRSGVAPGNFMLGQGAMEYILTHGSSLDFKPIPRGAASAAAIVSHLQPLARDPASTTASHLQPLEPQFCATQLYTQHQLHTQQPQQPQPPAHRLSPFLYKGQQNPAQAVGPGHGSQQHSAQAVGPGPCAAFGPGSQQHRVPAVGPGSRQHTAQAVGLGSRQHTDQAVGPGSRQITDQAVGPGCRQHTDQVVGPSPALEPGSQQPTLPETSVGAEGNQGLQEKAQWKKLALQRKLKSLFSSNEIPPPPAAEAAATPDLSSGGHQSTVYPTDHPSGIQESTTATIDPPNQPLPHLQPQQAPLPQPHPQPHSQQAPLPHLQSQEASLPQPPPAPTQTPQHVLVQSQSVLQPNLYPCVPPESQSKSVLQPNLHPYVPPESQSQTVLQPKLHPCVPPESQVGPSRSSRDKKQDGVLEVVPSDLVANCLQTQVRQQQEGVVPYNLNASCQKS